MKRELEANAFKGNILKLLKYVNIPAFADTAFIFYVTKIIYDKATSQALYEDQVFSVLKTIWQRNFSFQLGKFIAQYFALYSIVFVVYMIAFSSIFNLIWSAKTTFLFHTAWVHNLAKYRITKNRLYYSITSVTAVQTAGICAYIFQSPYIDTLLKYVLNIYVFNFECLIQRSCIWHFTRGCSCQMLYRIICSCTLIVYKKFGRFEVGI